MNKKICKINFLVSILTILSLTTACWNNRDITDIAIAVGVGLDKTDSGEIELTIELVNPSAIQAEEGGGGGRGNSPSSIEVSASGATIFAAARNLIGHSSRKMFFSHIQVVIIGESLARDGLGEIIDFWERDHETRRKADFLIAKGITAKEILKTQTQIENLTSIHFMKSLEASNAIGKIRKITLFDIIQQIHEPGRSVVIGTVSPGSASEAAYIEDMEFQGASVFKYGRLIGFLSPSETRGFLFATDKIQSTILTVPNPLVPEKLFAVEVFNSKGNVEAKLEKNQLKLKIKVEAMGNLGEIIGEKSLVEFDLLNTLQRDLEESIKKEISQAVKKAQQEYQSDIFGFGGVLYRKQYEDWLKLEDNWENIFSNTPIEIDVKFSLNTSGLIKEPAFSNIRE
ncbi:Ger(x)C family spore germination protein [Geosporobacter ferrireducens]|uniref:Ger(x)C family spore germination protein n=1 Tax=Geosporobacter ferrireducens TaxID=1424294 RepID=UPI00139C58AF|nr:Ger(x)C family spore germination protein [Geosporobacter ferrireducens]MTI56440.1 Ger(x)C family spore germination protein [Geosporobacter ferrireducens]